MRYYRVLGLQINEYRVLSQCDHFIKYCEPFFEIYCTCLCAVHINMCTFISSPICLIIEYHSCIIETLISTHKYVHFASYLTPLITKHPSCKYPYCRCLIVYIAFYCSMICYISIRGKSHILARILKKQIEKNINMPMNDIHH